MANQTASLPSPHYVPYRRTCKGDSTSPAPPRLIPPPLSIIGFVFSPPDWSILIQPSEVTRLVSFPNWLCLALFRFLVLLSGNVWMRLCHRLAAVAYYAATQAHPVLVIRPASAICHSPLATRHSSGGTRWTRVVQFPGLPVPFRASLGRPIQRGPSFSACRLPASPALQ